MSLGKASRQKPLFRFLLFIRLMSSFRSLLPVPIEAATNQAAAQAVTMYCSSGLLRLSHGPGFFHLDQAPEQQQPPPPPAAAVVQQQQKISLLLVFESSIKSSIIINVVVRRYLFAFACTPCFRKTRQVDLKTRQLKHACFNRKHGKTTENTRVLIENTARRLKIRVF